MSVVLPTYNRADLVTRAVESVLAQSFSDLELIIIVDGSTDATMERLAPYRDRARIVFQENAGLGAARNAGMALARGRFVAFLDDDDFWHPDKIRLQVEFFRAHPQCSLVCTATGTANTPDIPMDEILSLRNAHGIIERPILKKVAGKLLIVPSSMMYDRERAPDAKFYAVKGCLEDVAFIADVLADGALGVAGNIPLVRYNVGTAGSLASNANLWILAAHHMRRELRAGRLGPRFGTGAADTRELVAFIARSAAVTSLRAGRFAEGAKIYRHEFLPQLRLGRVRFLAGFPPLFIKLWFGRHRSTG